jgi:broad-specificity NMP kinase
MQVLLDEAKEAYSETMIVELQSNNEEDQTSNVHRIASWLKENSLLE